MRAGGRGIVFMASQFELPIHIFIKPSPWLTGGIIVIHLGAALALFAADINWLARCVVVCIVTANLAQALVTHVLQKRPDTPVQLLLTAGGEWSLTSVSGQTFAVELLPAAYVHPLLTVLSFRGG